MNMHPAVARLLFVLLGLLLLIGPIGPIGFATAAPADANAPVVEIPLDGPVGPATADFVTRALRQAGDDGAPLVILRIDTPGGLSSSMRDIVKAVLASDIPVVGYVAPSGARAASAGTYILYATHIAAMAPATNLGAATPVNIGGGGDKESKKNNEKENGDTADANGSNTTGDTDNTQEPHPDLGNTQTERRKQVNDAVAYIRGLAEQRGRNADWAEKAVRNAATLSASQAKKQNVIDLVAVDESALLHALDGRKVTTAAGDLVLHTAGLSIDRVEPGWRTELLATITNPTVAYLLFMIGIIGLAAEAFSPGIVLPGVVGSISLIAALYAFNMLPVDFSGAALILLGVLLIVAEAFVPSFGALGLGGIVALLFGSVMLMNTPGYDISLAVILAIGIATAALLGVIVWQFSRSRRTRIETGHEGLVGRVCTARHDFDDRGRVWLHGESWRAETDVPVVVNQSLVVTAVRGLTVTVRPAEAGDLPE